MVSSCLRCKSESWHSADWVRLSAKRVEYYRQSQRSFVVATVQFEVPRKYWRCNLNSVAHMVIRWKYVAWHFVVFVLWPSTAICFKIDITVMRNSNFLATAKALRENCQWSAWGCIIITGTHCRRWRSCESEKLWKVCLCVVLYETSRWELWSSCDLLHILGCKGILFVDWAGHRYWIAMVVKTEYQTATSVNNGVSWATDEGQGPLTSPACAKLQKALQAYFSSLVLIKGHASLQFLLPLFGIVP